MCDQNCYPSKGATLPAKVKPAQRSRGTRFKTGFTLSKSKLNYWPHIKSWTALYAG